MTQPPEIETVAKPSDKASAAKPMESEQSVATKLIVELGPLLVFFGVNAAVRHLRRHAAPSW